MANVELAQCDTLTPENLGRIQRLLGLRVRVSVPEFDGYGVLRIVDGNIVVESAEVAE